MLESSHARSQTQQSRGSGTRDRPRDRCGGRDRGAAFRELSAGCQGRSSRGHRSAIRMLASRVAIWMRLAIERDVGHEEAFAVWPERTPVLAEAICFVIPSRASLPIISKGGSAGLSKSVPAIAGFDLDQSLGSRTVPRSRRKGKASRRKREYPCRGRYCWLCLVSCSSRPWPLRTRQKQGPRLSRLRLERRWSLSSARTASS